MAITSQALDFKINKIYQTAEDAKNNQNSIEINALDIEDGEEISYYEYGDGTVLIKKGDTQIGWTTLEELGITNESQIETKILEDGSTETIEEKDGKKTITFRNKEGKITYTQEQEEGKITTKSYDENENIKFKSIVYESGAKSLTSYNEEGGVSEFTLYDSNGEKVVNLTEPMKWVWVGDYEYHINKNGTLSINPITDYSPCDGKLGEDGSYFYRVSDNGLVTITRQTGDHEGDVIAYFNSIDDAIDAGYIKKSYDFEERTTFTREDFEKQDPNGNYYYPNPASRENGLNKTSTICCVWYVVGRINEVRDELGVGGDWTYCGNGDSWYYQIRDRSYNTNYLNADDYGISTDVNDVRAGAVISYSPAHVVYVESVNEDGTVNISEANVSGDEAGFSYTSHVKISDLETFGNKQMTGMVFTLPEE